MLELTNAPVFEAPECARVRDASSGAGSRWNSAARASNTAPHTPYDAPRLERLGRWRALMAPESMPPCDADLRLPDDDVARNAASAYYARVPGVIHTELDTELVLLDPAGRQMFSLNATGHKLWRALPHCTIAEAALFLAEEFDVRIERATRDAIALVRELVHAGLLDSRRD